MVNYYKKYLKYKKKYLRLKNNLLGGDVMRRMNGRDERRKNSEPYEKKKEQEKDDDDAECSMLTYEGYAATEAAPNGVSHWDVVEFSMPINLGCKKENEEIEEMEENEYEQEEQKGHEEEPATRQKTSRKRDYYEEGHEEEV